MTTAAFRYTLCLIILGGIVGLQAEKTDIRFFTPKRTGDAYWFIEDRDLLSTTLITENGKPVSSQRNEFKSQFEANAVVVRANDVGRAIEERFEVIKFTVIRPDQTEPTSILPPGTLFYGRLELGEKVFTSPDGKELPQAVTNYLKQIIGLRDNSITDQDLLGPGGLVSPGETWPVNGNLVAEDFNFDLSLLADGEHVDGTVTFVEKATIDGQDYARIEKQINLSNVKVPPGRGMNTIKGTVNASTTATLPLSGPVYPYEQNLDLETVIIMQPIQQRQLARRAIMVNSTISSKLRSKWLPRDESVTEFDRTIGSTEKSEP
ncbi:MAG: hypothetical protein AAGA45_02270 [Verrucomicrobiota bacterium]